MIEGKIRTLDPIARRMVVALADGRELSIRMPPTAAIEIPEPETMGTMGGTLGDLEEGYLVQIEAREADAEGTLRCESLVCLS